MTTLPPQQHNIQQVASDNGAATNNVTQNAVLSAQHQQAQHQQQQVQQNNFKGIEAYAHHYGTPQSVAYATGIPPTDFYLYNQAYHYSNTSDSGGHPSNTGGTWSNADTGPAAQVASQHPYLSYPAMDYGAAGFGLAATYNMWSAGGQPWSVPHDYGDLTASWGRGGGGSGLGQGSNTSGTHDSTGNGVDYYDHNLKANSAAVYGGYSGHQLDYDRQSALRTLDQSFKHFGIGDNATPTASKADDFPSISVGSASLQQGGNSASNTGKQSQATSWAKIASQPAKGSAASVAPLVGKKSSSHMTVEPTKAPGRGTPGMLSKSSMHWESGSAGGFSSSGNGAVQGGFSHSTSGGVVGTKSTSYSETGNPETDKILRDLRAKINPSNFDTEPKQARFFVIKSYSEDDIHRSIKYGIWCSTEHGNKKLDQAFREQSQIPGGCVYLFFSVNGSGHFCGLAKMESQVDYDTRAGVWCQDKWRGKFQVQWIYVKDVPNNQLRHIRLETNENKPVTNSRDATEVPLEKGRAVIKVIHSFKHQTSIFDDFTHYERREQEKEQGVDM